MNTTQKKHLSSEPSK